MLVRVRMIGSGTEGDAYRAPLPTYREVLTLPEQGIVYAIIPEDDHPALHEHASAKVETTGHGPMLTSLDKAGHHKWHSHLDERYAERKGEFRPEIV